MCGIIGIISPKKTIKKKDAITLIKSAFEVQKHRGKDSFGSFLYDYETGKRHIKKSLNNIEKLFLDKQNVILFHHRLASVGEVSIRNQHPHTDINKNIALIHNGTFRDYIKYKDNFNGLKSNTDTEIIVNLISQSIDNLKKIRNSALVFYNKNDDTISFWRDKKPLIFGYRDDILIFASERKTLFKMSELLFGSKHFGFINRVPTAELPEHYLYTFTKDLKLKTVKKIAPETPKPAITGYSRTSWSGWDYSYDYESQCPFDVCYSSDHTQSPCLECEEIYGCGSDCDTCPFRGGCEIERQRKKFGCSLCDIAEVATVEA